MSAPLEIEIHPFPALLPPQATVMMMGTFPPKEDKRAMQFHYPNFQNDMWRVYGLVFFNDAAHFQMPRPLQNSPKSPKFPPRHLGDFP